ncbi:MAG: response regulator, partial [Treponema sp.]|nr:response regulator [Treponema sp.]
FLDGLQTKTYDAIILDVFIPDMNGLEILKSLQAQPSFTTPILIYSQTNSREIVIQTLSLGAKGYLTKPQKPQVIVAKTMEILNS